MTPLNVPGLRRLFLWVGLMASLFLAEGASALTLTYTPFEVRYSMPPSLDLQINSSRAWQDGGLSGTGAINKIGAGLLVLSGTNTYTGTTTVTAGTLQFARTLSLYNNVPAQWTNLSVLSGAGAYFNVGGAGEFTSADIATVSAAAGVFKAGSTLGLDTSNAPSSLFSFSNNINAANFAVTKQGLGTLSLSGSNNFAGGFTIGQNFTVVPGQFIYGGTANSSRVTLASAGALGTSGTIFFQGGSLQFTASNKTDYSSRFSQADGQLFNIDTNGQNVTFASALKAGSFGRLTKTGSGTLTLTALNTPGTVGVQGGTLRISAGELNSSVSPGDIEIIDGALLVAGGTVNSFRAYVGSDGSLHNLSQLDLGYLPASRNASATVSSGLWQVAGLAIGTRQQTGVVSVTGGTIAAGSVILGGHPFDSQGGFGTLNLSGSGVVTASSVDIGATNGVGVANVSGGRMTIANTLTVGSNYGYAPSVLLNLTSGTISAGDIKVGTNATGTLNVSGGLLSGTGTMLIGGLNSADNGTVNLSGSGTVNSSVLVRSSGPAATLNVNGGVLNAPSLSLYSSGGTAALHVTGGRINATDFSTQANTLITISGGTTAVTGTMNLNYLNGSGGALNLSGGSLVVGELRADNQIHVSGGSLAMGSGVTRNHLSISGTGAVSVASGSGTLFLLYNGGFTTGHLNLGGDVGGPATTAGTLNADAVSGGFSFGNFVNFNNTGTYAFAPKLQGYLGVTKSGAGTTQLTGSNNYLGGTVLNAGTLEIGSANALSTGLITINGGALRAAGEERTLTNSVVLAGDFTLGRQTNFAGDVTLTNNITITSANPDSSAPVTSIISGPITGAYGLTFATGLNPIGTIILSGSNSYSGGTTIQSGTVQIGNSGTTGSVNGNIVDNGSLVFARSDSVNIINTISGTGMVWQAGAGTLTLSASNSYSGGTTVSAGTLGIGGDSALGTGAITITGGGIRAVGQARTLSNALFTSGTFVLGRATSFTGTTTLLGNTTIIASNPDGPANADSSFGGPIGGNFGVTLLEGSGTAGIGAGYLVFNGSNSYTGGTILRTRLSINSDAALGATSGALTMDGGTLRQTASIASNRNVILNGTGGTFEIGGNFSTFSGTISGAGGVTMTSGFLRLNGPTLYTGSTTINGGSLKFGNSGTGFSTPSTPGVTINSGGALYFGDNVLYGGPITGAGRLEHEFTGTTILTGTNSYAGGTRINGGALQLGNGGTTGSIVGNVDNNLGDLRFNRSDAVNFSGTISGSGGVSQVGTGTTILSGNNTYTDSTTITAGTLSIGAGGTTGSIASASVLNNAALAFNRSDAQTYGGNISGTGSLAKLGTNLLTLTGSNTYTGGTVINAGQLNLGHANALGAGALAVNSGTLNLLGRSVTVASLSGSSAAVITSSTTGALTFTSSQSADTTYAGTISNGLGTLSLAKSGSGTLTLTGSNPYTGGTVLSGGVLSLGNAQAIAGSGTISFSGGTLQSTGSNTTDYSSRFSQTAGQLYSLDTNGQNVTLSGTLASSGGSLTKLGAGTLTLTAGNSYAGVTTISGGTLQIGAGGATGSIASASIVNNSLLAFNRSDAQTFGGVISGTGSLAKLGANLLTLTGSNTYSGATTISSGTLQIGDGNTTGSIASGTVANSGVLAFNRSDAQTYSGVISGTGSLAKLGANLLTLTGSNTYSGATTISSGTLQIGAGSSTGSLASASVVNNAALAFNRSNASTFDGVVSGTGSLTKLGLGTLTLTGSNSYTGATSISAGVLRIGNGGTTGMVGSGTIFNNIAGGVVGLQFNRSDAFTVGNTIVGTGGVGIVGTGTTIFTGGNTYSGFTSISNGATLQGSVSTKYTGNQTVSSVFGVNLISTTGTASLQLRANGLDDSSAQTLTVSNALQASSGGDITIDVNREASSTGSNKTIALGTATSLNLGISASGTTVVNVTGGNGYALSFGNISLAGGATSGSFLLNPTTANLTVGSASSAGAAVKTLILGGTSTGNIVSGAIADGSGTVSLIKDNASTWTLTGASSYTGATTISGGVLQIGNGGTTGSIASANVIDNATLAFNRSNTGTYAGVISGSGSVSQLGSGTTILSGSNTYTGATTISAGTLQIGAGSTTGSINSTSVVNNAALAFNRSNALTYAGSMSGTGRVSQIGSGNTTLSGSSSYTGGTVISSGKVILGHTNALGSGPLTVNLGTLDLNGQNLTVSSLSGTSAAGTITTGTAGSYVFIASQSADTTYAGTITNGLGTLSLAKSGSGTLTLTGSNSYTGNTTIAEGTLVVARTLGLGNYLGDIANNGVLSVASTSDQILAGVISGSGSLVKDNSGTLTLTADNTFTGGTTITSGALQLGNNTATGSVTGDITNNASLVFNRSNTVDYSGVISGTGALTKAGAGTLTLTGNNTSTGGTTISAGNLQIGNFGTTGSILGDIVNNGSLTFLRSDSTTFAGNISGTGSLSTNNYGAILKLTGTNSYAGGTTISNGFIEFATGANLGTGNITLIEGGLRWAPGNTTDISSRLSVLGDSEGAVFDTNGNNVTFASSIFGTSFAGEPYSYLAKGGAGTLTLGGATNIRKFFVEGGTLDFGTGTYEGSLEIGSDYYTLDPSSYGPSAAILSGAGTSFHTVIDGIVGNFNSQFSSTLTVTNGAAYTGFNDLKVGTGGTGQASLVVSSGGSVSTSSTFIGNFSHGLSVASVSGAGSTFTAVNLYVGSNTSFDQLNTDNSSMTFSNGATGSVTTTVIGRNGALGANSLTLSGTTTKFTTGSLTVAQGGSDNGTVNIGSAAGDAAAGGGILDTATVTGGSGAAVLQFNTIGDDLAPTYFTRDGTSSGTGVNTAGGLSLVNTAGTTILTGNAAHTGGTTINGGSLQIGAGGTTGSLNGNVALASGGTFAFNRSNALTYTGTISGTGRVSQIGTGALTFSGSNTYTGGTTITSGTLAKASNNAVGTGTVVVEGGVFLIENGVTGTNNAVTLSGGEYQRVLSGNIAHAVDATSSFAGGDPDTTAQILAGALTASGTLSSAFANTSSALNDEIRLTDVYAFQGTGSDIFVLQLSFTATSPDAYLGWLSGNQWVNARDGNTGNNPLYASQFDGTFAEFQILHGFTLSDYVGAWGVDVSGGATSTWVVLNHNSDFAAIGAVPEPSTMVLLTVSLGGMLLFRRARGRRKAL